LALTKAFRTAWKESGLGKELSGVFNKSGINDFKQYLNDQHFAGQTDVSFFTENGGMRLRRAALSYLETAKSHGMNITDTMHAFSGTSGFKFEAGKNSGNRINEILKNRDNEKFTRQVKREEAAQRSLDEGYSAATSPGYHGNDSRITDYGKQVGELNNYEDSLRNSVEYRRAQLGEERRAAYRQENRERQEAFNEGRNNESLSRRAESQNRGLEYKAQLKQDIGSNNISGYVQEQRAARRAERQARKEAGRQRAERLSVENERLSADERRWQAEMSRENVSDVAPSQREAQKVPSAQSAQGGAESAAAQDLSYNNYTSDLNRAKLAAGKDFMGRESRNEYFVERMNKRKAEIDAMKAGEERTAAIEKFNQDLQSGPGINDYLMGNKIPHKAAGFGIAAVAADVAMGDGRRSNAQLYSSPF